MFLSEPPTDAAVRAVYDADLEADGYVNNSTRLWAWRPDVTEAFAAVRSAHVDGMSLTAREVAVLVAATASARSDSYCSLAWGTRLAGLSTDTAAGEVLSGAASPGLDERENLLAEWARRVVHDPNATTQDDVDRLRAAGLTDLQILETTVFVAFRLAFSTVNDALGALPDHALAAAAPDAVRRAVSYGRPTGPAPAP